MQDAATPPAPGAFAVQPEYACQLPAGGLEVEVAVDDFTDCH